MLITQLYGDNPKNFHIKYPNAIIIESEPFGENEFKDMVAWSKENLIDNALVTWKSPYNTLIWYCSSVVDAMAVKLKWT